MQSNFMASTLANLSDPAGLPLLVKSITGSGYITHLYLSTGRGYYSAEKMEIFVDGVSKGTITAVYADPEKGRTQFDCLIRFNTSFAVKVRAEATSASVGLNFILD